MDTSNIWAAGIGAAAAFAFEALLRWRDRSRAEQDAANSAVMTLSQMYTHLENIRRQAYEERDKFVRQLMNRDAHAIELLPLTIVSDHALRLDMRSLAFLLRTHDPDLTNRLAVVERCYVEDMSNEARRAHLHLQMQARLSQAGAPEEGLFDVATAKQIAGYELIRQLEMITDAQRKSIPKTLASLLKVQRDLVDVVSAHFPTRRFARFQPTQAVDVDAREPQRAAAWRRALRAIVRWFRKKKGA